MPTGDKVIFPLINQRVDKKDLDDMMVLLQETISRTVASLIGEGAGALTTIPNTWDSVTDTVTFGACMLAYSRPRVGSSDPNAFNFLEGGVVIHDPNRPAQNGNSSVALGGLSTGHFWFKRNTVDADIDNRAHWPGSNSGEVVQSTPTRNREYVNFAVTASRSGTAPVSEATGWSRFAVFQKFVLGGVTTLQVAPLSAFGDDRGSGGTAESLMGYWANTPSTRKWGLNRLARDVINSILQMKDTDVTVDAGSGALTANPNVTLWKNPPVLGLRQASVQIADLAQQITGLQGQITALQQQQGLLATSVVSSPKILGMVYLRPYFNPDGLLTGSVAKQYDYVLSGFKYPNPGLTMPSGGGPFSAFFPGRNSVVVDTAFSNFTYIDIAIRPQTAIIDHISASIGLYQNWDSGSGDHPALDDQVIGDDTRPLSIATSYILYPKNAATVSTGAGDRPPVYVPSGGYNVTLIDSDFIIRVKISRDSGEVEVAPFTLVVYGRDPIPGLTVS
jgi:hypothetical protein